MPGVGGLSERLGLTGDPLGTVDSARLDRALALLREPTTLEDRLHVLQQLVEFWHGPICPQDGMTDAQLTGMSLPWSLQWWYRWAGKRKKIMSGQNRLMCPGEKMLTVKDGNLRFYVENQFVYQWSTLPHGMDPPVFGRYNDTDP